MIMGGILAVLPFVLLIAFAIGGDARADATPVTLMDTATASGANFAAVNLFVSAGFLLVIPVALFCGDTVASEASWSSLRYLLAAPVPRARLLWSKLVVGLGLSLAAMVLLPVVALAVGTAAYGWGPLEIPTGGELGAGTAAQRLASWCAYLFVSQLVTAGLAFWLSTKTDAPLGAVGGAVGLTIVGNVLDAVTALGDWRDFLPAHWQFAWADAVQPPEWSGMIQGTAVSVRTPWCCSRWPSGVSPARTSSPRSTEDPHRSRRASLVPSSRGVGSVPWRTTLRRRSRRRSHRRRRQRTRGTADGNSPHPRPRTSRPRATRCSPSFAAAGLPPAAARAAQEAAAQRRDGPNHREGFPRPPRLYADTGNTDGGPPDNR